MKSDECIWLYWPQRKIGFITYWNEYNETGCGHKLVTDVNCKFCPCCGRQIRAVKNETD